MLWSRQAASSSLVVTSDALGSWGCGAIHNTSWFQLAWPSDLASKPIHCEEIVPIVGACLLWGSAWKQNTVTFKCDNIAVVEVINRGYSNAPITVYVLRGRKI